MEKSAPGAIHGLCWASAKVGAALCAAAGPAPDRREGERARHHERGEEQGRAASERGPSQRAAEDAQTGREDLEPERLVERERVGVLELGVHVGAGGAVAPDPGERVGDERVAPVVAGAASGCTAMRCRYPNRPATPVIAYASTRSRSRARRNRLAGVASSASLSPTGPSRQNSSNERSSSSSTAARSRRAALTNGSVGGVGGRSRSTREQVEALLDGEPGVDERLRFTRAHRAR